KALPAGVVGGSGSAAAAAARMENRKSVIMRMRERRKREGMGDSSSGGSSPICCLSTQARGKSFRADRCPALTIPAAVGTKAPSTPHLKEGSLPMNGKPLPGFGALRPLRLLCSLLAGLALLGGPGVSAQSPAAPDLAQKEGYRTTVAYVSQFYP